MDSSVSETCGRQEGSAHNGHFGCTCCHPLFCFNHYGDLEGAMLREGNLHYHDFDIALLFRGDGRRSLIRTSTHTYSHVSVSSSRTAACGRKTSSIHWSMTTLREQLIKTGAKVASHARYTVFQMAGVAVSKNRLLTIELEGVK